MSDAKRWYKIWRGDAKGKILDISDPEPKATLLFDGDEGRAAKLCLSFTRYDVATNQSQAQTQHWLDLDVARLLAWDLVTGKKGEAGREPNQFLPIWKEFKGGPARGVKIPGVTDGMLLSRTFGVSYMTHLKGEALRSGPVYQFHFQVSEGEKGDKGQVMPKSGARPLLSEQINLPVPLARRFGITLLHYLQARDAAALARL